MFFKKQHVKLILAGRKTQTRRLPGSADYSVGRVYAMRDRWFSKAQGYILITRKFKQRLGEISPEDIRKEDYKSLEEFRRAWEEINGEWNPNQTVIVYEFKPVPSKPGFNGLAAFSPTTRRRQQKNKTETEQTERR